MQKQKKYIDNLSQELKDTLIWYTGDDYSMFNRRIRAGLDLTPEYKKKLSNLEFIFENAPPLENSITVYKGIIGSNVYSDKAFISTSLRYDSVLKFAETYKNCCVLEITVSKGSKALPLQSLTKYKDEYEVLLDRNGTLICNSNYVKKVKGEEDMTMLCCIYAKGTEIKSDKDVMKAKKEIKVEEQEKDVIDRILRLVDPDELELYDSSDEIYDYVKSLADSLHTSKKISKNILEDVVNHIKCKYKM